MRLAIVLMALLLAAAPASAQTVSVSGEGSLTTITAERLRGAGGPRGRVVRAQRPPAISRASRSGEGCRFTGVPAFNPIGANFRYGCLAGPNFRVTLGAGNDIVVKRNQGAHEPFDVEASLGAGSDTLMFAGPGVHGSDTLNGGSGRDGLNYTLCTCPDGVTAALRNGFEAIVGSPGPDTLTGLAEGATAEPAAARGRCRQRHDHNGQRRP